MVVGVGVVGMMAGVFIKGLEGARFTISNRGVRRASAAWQNLSFRCGTPSSESYKTTMPI